jgi:hypothetical protein
VPPQRRQQRGLPDQRGRGLARLAVRHPGPVEKPAAERVVVEPGHGAQPGVDVPPAPHLERHGAGRGVERPGRRGAPVDQQRVVVQVLVHDPDAADVPALAGLKIEPAEAQAVLGRVELHEPAAELAGRHVPLHQVLLRAAGIQPHPRQPVLGPPPQRVEPAVEHAHVPLLAGDFFGFA